MRPVLAVVTAVAVLGAADAAAAATWSPARNVSTSGQQTELGSLAFDKHGRALAAWSELKQVQGKFHVQYVPDGWRTATRVQGAELFSAPRAAPNFVTAPLLYSTSRALGLDQTAGTQVSCGTRGTLRARFGTSSGSFDSAPQTIATFTSTVRGGPALGVNDAGLAVAAWSDISTKGPSCNATGLLLSMRKPGGRFAAPGTLRGKGQPQDPSVAVGARGDILVAWQQRTGEGEDGSTIVQARYEPAGHSWSPVVALGHGNISSRPQTAVASNGRAYVAWGSAQISESIGQHGSFYVAVWPAGAKTPRAAQRLESIGSSTEDLMSGPSLALAGTNALVAWTGRDDANWRVRVAQTDSSGRFGAPQTVSPPSADAALDDLAALPDGAATVAWTGMRLANGSDQAQTIVAAYRPPAVAAFGAPETVYDTTLARPDSQLGSLPGAVALSPTTVQPVVVWPLLGRTTQIPSYLVQSRRTFGG